MNDLGLRARKAARTRRQLAECALALFIEKGYDATTLEAVAEVAEVHKRTLLRYFPTKAHLVLYRRYEDLADFRIAMANRGSTPTVDVWQDVVERGSRNLMQLGPLGDQRRIAANEPAIEPALLAIQAEYMGLIIVGLEADCSALPDVRIVARVVASALVFGNHTVAAMVFADRDYDKLESAELKVLRMVREKLLPG